MRYDLHGHTHYSRCSNLRPNIILKLAKKKGLNGIAITDHEEVKGAIEVKKLNKDSDFEVIIGEEIHTNYGDVLVYYLSEKIRKNDFHDVIELARKQNALVSLAHPFRTTLVNDHKFKLPIAQVKRDIDAIECFNARMMFPGNNMLAFGTAEKLDIAKTAGSDSHFWFEIGTGYTVFEGSLRKAIKRKETLVEGKIKFGAFGGALSYLKKKFI